MIVDHRTYTLHPGKLKGFLELYETKGYPVQVRHLGEPVGWYTSHDIGPLNQIVHLWGYDDLQDRAARRAKLAADPGWQAYLAEAQPMFLSMENKILTSPPFVAGASPTLATGGKVTVGGDLERMMDQADERR